MPPATTVSVSTIVALEEVVAAMLRVHNSLHVLPPVLLMAPLVLLVVERGEGQDVEEQQ